MVRGIWGCHWSQGSAIHPAEGPDPALVETTGPVPQGLCACFSGPLLHYSPKGQQLHVKGWRGPCAGGKERLFEPLDLR